MPLFVKYIQVFIEVEFFLYNLTPGSFSQVLLFNISIPHIQIHKTSFMMRQL